ncbi:hypothetical protein DL546_005383 [Coniochaeta pulveracea]|nr:hypothetical protein DL546_005383 [Coniochaeta pulveracea]
MAIRGQEGMVQCLGDFEHHQQAAQGPQTTYNILLEFGQFHLGEFFAEPQTYPPVLQQEILLFWKKFFKVADAISSIHELTHTTEGGSTRRYNGWHADIKPENIMRVYGEFKLSDFGFAKFANYSNRPLSYIDGGTATYGAPEMDTERRMRGTKTALTQAIDVWSFACVLSVTATWAILGVQGVLQYEQVRESAIRDLPGDRRPSSSAAFHNGTKVLPEVLEWHQLLRTCRRESDPITDKILDLIDDRMLLADPDERIPIKELCSKRDALVEEAERALKRPEVQVSQPILEKLLQFDREPPTTSSKEDEGSTMYPARNARGKESQGKSRLPKENSVPQAKPGKVVYRAEALSTALEGVKDIQRQTRATDPGTTAETNNEFTSFLTWSPVDVTPSGRGQQATDPMQTKLPGEPHPAEGNPRREPGLTAQEFPNPPTNEARDGRTRVVTASPETFTSPRLSSIVSGSAVGYPDPIAGEISASDSQRVGPYTVQRTLMHLQTGRSLSTAPEVVLSPSPTRAPLVMSSPTSSAPRFNTEGTRPCPLYSPYGHYQTKAESFAMFKERKELEGRVRKSWSFRKQERDKDLKKIIEDRDIVFVVDRSSTMGQCWPWVTFWVETLAMKLARLDDDGLDLVFTGSGNLDHMGCKHAKEFKTRMDKAQRELDPMPTDMAGCLSRIFSTYRQNRKYARRALTLIVVTDGSWSVPANRQRGNKVEDNIVDFVNELQRTSQDVHDKVKYRRWFSIQFVSFATDPVAHANLKHLDSVMWKERGIPDVIDTKPWDHSIVNNLILGSLHEFADDSDEEPSTAVTGSTSAWRHP